jgi:hypothetical protein
MAQSEEEKKLREREQREGAMQIRAGIEGLKNLPFIPADIKERINKELPTYLPVIKEQVKEQLYKLSQRLGTGAGAKTYMLRNGAKGPAVTMWKDLYLDPDEVKKGRNIREMNFPLEKIAERIDTYTSLESLIADVFTLRILNMEDEPKTEPKQLPEGENKI